MHTFFAQPHDVIMNSGNDWTKRERETISICNTIYTAFIFCTMFQMIALQSEQETVVLLTISIIILSTTTVP